MELTVKESSDQRHLSMNDIRVTTSDYEKVKIEYNLSSEHIYMASCVCII